ncbi:MAG TPA: DUF4157 domain-containing protein, partial [Chloroflexota bacterium]|nr:DUF4157 domain-containing protein [Chloroflexota bacterium]
MQQTHGNRHTQRFLQRAAGAAAPVAGEQLAHRIEAEEGRGAGLEAPVQAELESGLGADLSNVRVHTDGEADYLARSVDSVAFTSGQDIFFRSGAYNPQSSDGLHLLAHETAHTVQQAQGPVAGTPGPGGVSISSPSDSFEQAASRAASQVVAGGRASVQPSPAGGAGGISVQRAFPIAAGGAFLGLTAEAWGTAGTV